MTRVLAKKIQLLPQERHLVICHGRPGDIVHGCNNVILAGPGQLGAAVVAIPRKRIERQLTGKFAVFFAQSILAFGKHDKFRFHLGEMIPSAIEVHQCRHQRGYMGLLQRLPDLLVGCCRNRGLPVTHMFVSHVLVGKCRSPISA